VNSETKYMIEKLNLRKLYEEGGYYRETYRSEGNILINFSDNPNDKNKIYICQNLMMIRLICALFLH
jgi:predicted cupin superfamily sugar epimerase